jgi:hypothetical protein
MTRPRSTDRHAPPGPANGVAGGAHPPTPAASALSLHLDPVALQPLVELVVSEVLARVRADEARLADRLAYSEEEASRLLGLETHQLRDERLRGNIAASQIVGRRIRYTRDDLLRYLAARRLNDDEEADADRGRRPR